MIPQLLRKLCRSRLVHALLIFMLSQLLFLWGIGAPDKPYFDEVHYVPAALAMLDHQPAINLEHPPLAKQLIAASIWLWGNTPLGWRYASALFGSLALVGVYLWGLALFRDPRPALWATVATAFDQVFYIQSRIAMLDIFSLAFAIWGLAAFTATWARPLAVSSTALMTGCGAFFGLAAACKWIGIVPLGVIAATVAVVKILQGWQTTFGRPDQDDWYRPDLWHDMRAWHWLSSLIAVPFLSYYCAVSLGSPQGFSPSGFIVAQSLIWTENSTLGGTHSYMSSWPSWPLLIRPIWYLFEGKQWDTDDASAAAVLYLGNPLVLWGGFLAVGVCIASWIYRRRRDAFIIAGAYGAFWLCWAVIPRHLTFSFYYLPASTVLSLALAFTFYRTRLGHQPWIRRAFLMGSVAMFIYWLPLSNAAVRVSETGFNARMWLQSWR